jgi:predicted secreted hydrolase
MRGKILGLGLLALAVTTARADPIIPSPAVSLPADDAVHLLRCFDRQGNPLLPGRPCNPVGTDPATPFLEWHYWTVHLTAKDGRQFGAQWTFFTLLSPPLPGSPIPPYAPTTIGQFGITDHQAKTHPHVTAANHRPFTPAGDGFSFIATASDTDPRIVAGAVGGNGSDRLFGAVGGYLLSLELRETRAPVLHVGQASAPPGPPGFSAYPFGGYTFYYSREAMAVRGTVVVNGEALEVSGTGWFDHQLGNLDNAAEGGWDFFAIQLDDGRRIMAYLSHFFDAPLPPAGRGPRSLLIHGDVLDAAGRVTPLAAGDVAVSYLDFWTSLSPWPGLAGINRLCYYPRDLIVRVRQEYFIIRPVVADQEWPWDPANPFLVPYVESDSVVVGTSTGKAYVEFSGYKRLPLPPLYGFSPRSLGPIYVNFPSR